jgi:hypothetical protein
MKKSGISWSVLGLCLLFLNGCGEDELPKSTLEFDQDQHDEGALSVYESNGGVTSFHPLLYDGASGVQYEIEVNLNRPVAETTVIRFSTTGTATRSTATEIGDYDILSDGNLLVIEKGESSASIIVEVYEDYGFEIDSETELYEVFTIELEEVLSGTGKLGEFTTFDIFIYEDDPVIFLSWDPQDDPGEDAGDVDMDLIVWMDGEQLTASDASGTSFEAISLPAGFPNAEYGFSYTYYDGSSNDLDFYVDILNLGGNLNGSPDQKSYTKTYTLNNINEYTTSGIDPLIVQTMNKSGFNYVSLTDITVNATGSRIATGQVSLPKGTIGKFPIRTLDNQTLKMLKLARGL